MERTTSIYEVLCERLLWYVTQLSCYPYASNQAPPSTSTMSAVPSTSTSSTRFEAIFTAALKEYKKQTKTDIASHPLATQLQSCDSSSAIIAVLRTQVQTFDKDSDERWTKWLDPTVNVLFAFSATLGSGVGVVNVEHARDRPSDVRDHRYSHQQMQFLLELASFSK